MNKVTIKSHNQSGGITAQNVTVGQQENNITINKKKKKKLIAIIASIIILIISIAANLTDILDYFNIKLK